MRSVETLKSRVVKALEIKGFEINDSEYSAYTAHEKKAGEKWMTIHETCRGNGTEENVTVTIEVNTYHEAYNFEIGFGMISTIAKVKVPKNASDKVINNRIDKCIEHLA